MSRRYVFLAIALAVSAVCVRLGFWQLARLSQRRARNAMESGRLGQPVIDFARGSPDSVAPYRRVHATGRLDFARELAVTFRSHDGSPGVYLVTPLVRDGTDTLVLVNRGWVYSPDGVTVDLTKWGETSDPRNPGTFSLDGYALAFEPDRAASDSAARSTRAVTRLDRARLERRFGAPVAGYYLVMLRGEHDGALGPVRLGEPTFDDGPHLSYAVQWFLFAVTFGAGGVIVVLRDRRRRAPGGSP